MRYFLERRVGEIYSADDSTPETGTRISINNGINLAIFGLGITAEEIELFGGDYELGVYNAGNVMFLLMNFGAGWIDCPFCASLLQAWPKRAVSREKFEKEGYKLKGWLVDSTDWIVRASRTICLPLEFSKAIGDIVGRQLTNDVSAREYNSFIRGFYKSNPIISELIPNCTVFCRGH